MELALIENIQRENLNPIEEARAYARFQDEFGMTQREVATRIGKSREVVANTLRLLQLPTEVQDAIARGAVSESQGRLLLTVSDPKTQERLFRELLQGAMSVRELKAKIDATKPAASPAEMSSPAPAVDPEAMALEKELEAALGTKVKVEKSGASGKITITFFSPEELRGILEKLNPGKFDEILPPFSLGTPPMP